MSVIIGDKVSGLAEMFHLRSSDDVLKFHGPDIKSRVDAMIQQGVVSPFGAVSLQSIVYQAYLEYFDASSQAMTQVMQSQLG